MNQLNDIRDRISALQTEKSGIEEQPAAAADVKHAISAFVDSVHAPAVEYLRLAVAPVLHGGEPAHPFKAYGHPHEYGGTATDIGGLLVAILGKKQIEAALLASLGDLSSGGMSATERRKRLKEIDSELEGLYWTEADLVIDQGIEPRADADPHYYVMPYGTPRRSEA